ncbi:alpha/beta hydrolase [Jeongeupia sp. HS-3]|uniref:alpha/beta hydrolase n=1 Tax=Jeongeupia sp. HS-3 TaxID=1009682 RepID=UPI00190FCDC6|nr:alpha/beta fold hydrolase [Jeongeupia sp. HS-3]
MRKLWGLLAGLLMALPMATALAIVPPGDRDTQLDRWAERPEARVDYVTTDAPLNWSKLRVRSWRQPKPAPHVLLLHGATLQQLLKAGHVAPWGINDDPHALFYSMGFNVFELSRRGYEGSEGTPSEVAWQGRQFPDDDSAMRALLTDAAKDVKPVLAWLRTQPDVLPQGVILGHSFGGLLALHVSAAAPEIRAVVDVAGGYSSVGLAEPSKSATYAESAILDLTATRTPALLVYSPGDTLVPVALGHALAARSPATRQLVTPKTLEGRDPHSALIFGYNLGFWQDDLYAFLAKQLP